MTPLLQQALESLPWLILIYGLYERARRNDRRDRGPVGKGAPIGSHAAVDASVYARALKDAGGGPR